MIPHLSRSCTSSLLVRQQPFDRSNFVTSGLLLVGPASNADVGLYPYDAIGVQHTVTLAYDPHNFVPWAFYRVVSAKSADPEVGTYP